MAYLPQSDLPSKPSVALSTTDPALSNSLTDLAARIKAEHEAIKASLRESVQHAFAAGELLIEAKKQLKHGQWLPWLTEHCTISERTAQLYMRCAKNRDEMEKSARGIADLSLTEAAAMLVISSNVKKLLEFVKSAEGISDPDEFIEFCAEQGVATLQGNIFNAPEPTEQEWVEWALFKLFLVQRCGFTPDNAELHTDWILSRGSLLSEWMSEAGVKMRERWLVPCGPTLKTIELWNTFLKANRDRTLKDLNAEFMREVVARVELLERALAGGELSKKNRRLAEEELNRLPTNPKQLKAQHQAIAREAKAEQRKRRANAQRALRISRSEVRA